MRDVLITGGIGKIGLDLVYQLLDTDCNITILDLESKRSAKRLSKIKIKEILFGPHNWAALFVCLLFCQIIDCC